MDIRPRSTSKINEKTTFSNIQYSSVLVDNQMHALFTIANILVNHRPKLFYRPYGI